MPATLEIKIVGEDASGAAFASLTNNLANINPASEIATGALRRVGEIATDALGGAAQAAVGFVQDSVSAAGEFEAGINRFASVAGDALGQAGFSFDDVSAKALQLGAETSFSAAQAEDAMIALAKGGVPVVDIMGAATDATMNLAAAGEIELGTAADIVAKQLGVWAETGVTAADVSNIMAEAANAAVVDVDELALGLANVGGAARSGGVDFEELSQTMGLIAPNFSSAADAGTALKTMILNLSPATKPATDKMIELGLATADGASKFYDAQGSFIGMESAAGLLQGALAGLGEEQRMTALKTMFGADAIRAADALARAGSAGFEDFGDAMRQAGDAASQATQRNQGYAFALESMKGSVETLQIVIGTTLLPVLTQLITGVLTPGINAVMGFVQALQGSKDAFNSLAPPLKPIVAGIQDLISAFQSADEWSGSTAETIATLTAQFIGLFTGVKTGSPAFWALQAPIESVVRAVQPLVTLIGNNLQPILIAVAGILGGVVVAALASAVGAFLAVAAPIAALIALGAALVAAWQSNFGGIQTVVTSVLGAVWGVISAVVGQIATFWSSNSTQILNTASTVWNQIEGVISVALQLIQAVVVPILTGIATFITNHSAQIQQILGGAWQIISSVITTALSIIQGVITAALQIIQGDWSGAWETIKQTCADIVTGIIGILEGAVDGMAGGAQMAIDAIVGVWKAFTGWAGIGGGVVDGIIGGLGAAIGRLAAKAADMARSALNAAKEALGIASPSRAAHEEVGLPTGEGVASGLEASIPRVSGAASEVAGKVISTISAGLDVLTKLAGYGGVAWEPMARFGEDLQRAIDVFAALVDGTTAAALTAAAKFAEGAGKLLGFIGSAVDTLNKLSTLAEMPAGSFLRFSLYIETTINRFAEFSTRFDADAYAAALAFVTGAGKLLTFIGGAVDSLNKLADLAEMPAGSFLRFSQYIETTINRFAEFAARFDADAYAAALQFVTGAGKLLTFIGSAVDSLNKLAELAVMPAGSFLRFSLYVEATINRFAEFAAHFDAASYAAAAQFAAGAGRVLQILGSGVDNLNALADLAQLPAGVFLRFAADVAAVLAQLVIVAHLFSTEAVAAAAQFADGAGKAIAMIGSAVDNISKLRDFKDVPQQAILAFASSLWRAFEEMVQVAEGWTKAAYEQATAFADGAGKAIGMIGSAVDNISKLADFKDVPQRAIVAFGTALRIVVALLADVAAAFHADAIAAAAVFADGAGTMLGLVGAGVESLEKLAGFKGLSDAPIRALGSAITRLVAAVVQLSATISAGALSAATTFATGVARLVELIGQAIDSYAKLADFEDRAATVLPAFTTAIRDLLAQFERVAIPPATNLGLVLMRAMAQGIAQGGGTVAAALAAVSRTLAEQAVESVAAAVLTGIGGGGVLGAVKGGGGTTTTNHYYTITGYNAGQAGDLTTTIRQTQLLQQAIG